jgi:hypothetical protein
MSHESIRPSKSGKYLDIETWDALKAAGMSEQELQADQPFGPVIFSYTRAQAIADGVLVDVTEIAKTQGFIIHSAVTCGVSSALVEMVRRRRPDDFTKYSLERIQKAAIRAMFDVLHRHIVRQAKPSDRLDFDCGDLKLWSHVGPGDDGEAVLTVMLEGED